MTKVTIGFLSTRWGPHLGGINVFNAEFCRAVAKRKELEIYCFVEEANDQNYKEARQSGLTLYSINRRLDSSKESLHEIDLIIQKIGKSFDFWVGHDVWTGHAAVELTKIRGKGKSVVIHHMDFGAYAHLKYGDTDAHKRRKEQENLLKSADFAFGVGPTLQRSATKHLQKKAGQLSPGLPHIKASELTGYKLKHPSFEVLVIGRVSREDDAIKQVRLAVTAIIEATKYPWLDDVDWRVNVIGFDDKDVDDEYKKELKSLEEEGATHVNLKLLPFEKSQPDLHSEISRSDLVLMPSLREGFGLVGWEAIGAGVPVIITEFSGLYEHLYELGYYGMVGRVKVKGKLARSGKVDEVDVAELAKEIVDTYKDFDAKKRQALNLREILRKNEKASWENAVDEFMKGVCLGGKKSVVDKKQDPVEQAQLHTLHELLQLERWEVISLRNLLETWPIEDVDMSKNAAKMIYHTVNSKTSSELLGVIHHTLCWLGHEPDDEQFFQKAGRPQLPFDELDIEVVEIPEGSLIPGSNLNEIDRLDDEGPGEETQVHSFSLGKSVITNRQFAQFAPEVKLYRWSSMTIDESDHHPVVSVNWWQAYIYSIWAGGRLPTEIEWEYACRAGSSTPFYSGNQLSYPKVNARISKSNLSLTTNRTFRAIQEFTDHPFGLFHMHGNVWEWCWNTYDEASYPSARPKRYDYKALGPYKVAKGGSWGNPFTACRSAFRNRINPNYRNNDLGFRILRLNNYTN